MSRHCKRPGHARGFTLIETLVSLVVLSIAITMVLQLFSGGMNAKSRAEDYTRAVFHASEVMELLLASSTILEAPTAGEWEDGYSWSAELAEETDETAEPEDSVIKETGPKLYRLTVTVSWQRGEAGRHYSLTTLTLVNKTEP
ncbi:MAG: type II secretion system protein [Pseudomonadota bacterium]